MIHLLPPILRRHPPCGPLALFLLAPSCAPPESARAEADEGVAAPSEHEASTSAARLEPWALTLRVTGELVAFEEVTLSSEVSGRLASLTVDVGSRVRAGELVASVETRDYELGVTLAEAAVQAARARLASGGGNGADQHRSEDTAIVREAQAALDEARRERERLRTLLRDQTVAQSAFDAAEARFLGAESRLQGAFEQVEVSRAVLAQREAELAIARAELADTRIVAPFDGAVAERLAGTGEYLSVGRAVLRLVRFDPVRLRLEVPERDAHRVQVGLEVRFEAAPGSFVAGSLVRISPELDARTRTLVVEAELANPDGRLRPGAFVRAEIVVDPDAPALVVPPNALVRFAGVDKVFVVQDGVAVERYVAVGRQAEGRVEVLSGLAAREVVVLAPGGLKAGERVIALP